MRFIRNMLKFLIQDKLILVTNSYYLNYHIFDLIGLFINLAYLFLLTIKYFFTLFLPTIHHNYLSEHDIFFISFIKFLQFHYVEFLL